MIGKRVINFTGILNSTPMGQLEVLFFVGLCGVFVGLAVLGCEKKVDRFP
jgi:hypothetical protein